MKGRRLHFRPSLSDTKRINQKAMDYYLALSPREDAERFDVGAKPKQERGPVKWDESEGPVKNAVADLLAYHPKVAIAFRMNSGAVYNDKDHYVQFHHMVRGEGIATDFIGSLIDGRPFAIECKRPDWTGVSRAKHKTAIREQQQEKHINYVRSKGGVAGFARSADDAQAIVEGRS